MTQAGPGEAGAAKPVRFQIEATAQRRCPVCASAMVRKNYGQISGVIVDLCGPHGLYLDDGELEKIRAFVTSGGERLAANRKNQEARRHAEQIADLDRRAATAAHLHGAGRSSGVDWFVLDLLKEYSIR